MLEPLPPLASLYAFCLVAETGGLGAAAERLNVTQPAVSKRIRALEAQLGVALVHRGANSIRLTEMGRSYAAALGAAFGAVAHATAALQATPAPPLRVRAYNTWAVRWLIPRLSRFRTLHPEQEVTVTTSIAAVDFARDPVDAAVRAAELPPAPNAERLQPILIAPFAAPALARRARREGLGRMTLLGSHVRPGDWAAWAAATGTALPAAPLLFENTLLAVEAAIEGLGVVIASPNLVAEDLRRRRLAPLAAEAVATASHFWLLLPPGPTRPAAAAFRDWLRQEVAAELASQRQRRRRR